MCVHKIGFTIKRNCSNDYVSYFKIRQSTKYIQPIKSKEHTESLHLFQAFRYIRIQFFIFKFLAFCSVKNNSKISTYILSYRLLVVNLLVHSFLNLIFLANLCMIYVHYDSQTFLPVLVIIDCSRISSSFDSIVISAAFCLLSQLYLLFPCPTYLPHQQVSR